MDGIEFFKKLRDVSNDIVQAHDKEDTAALESAMGRFVLLMIQAESFKEL
ncbi:hypothetical protein [Pseudobacillus badius]|nr:hypothetical protein [Bacillus badius]